ncbi:hypothetical protein B0H16DRAFT_1472373 [Mycena metata]|uniref:Uncharacterized protein n=1 Tax=Mycena metata TaxID=1033252 RepID=A0AAD7MNU4_9AGAR|nr:hypothetical protein B0H16DRAFT_1472373 [Mycena metata]
MSSPAPPISSDACFHPPPSRWCDISPVLLVAIIDRTVAKVEAAGNPARSRTPTLNPPASNICAPRYRDGDGRGAWKEVWEDAECSGIDHATDQSRHGIVFQCYAFTHDATPSDPSVLRLWNPRDLNGTGRGVHGRGSDEKIWCTRSPPSPNSLLEVTDEEIVLNLNVRTRPSLSELAGRVQTSFKAKEHPSHGRDGRVSTGIYGL